MRQLLACLPLLALCCLLASPPAGGAALVTTVWLPDSRVATLAGQLRGYDQHDYRLPLRQGQLLRLRLDSSKPSTRFSLRPPGGGTALLQGAGDSSRYSVRILQDGNFTLRIYQTTDAARLGESSRFSLQLQALGHVGHDTLPAFRRQLVWQDIRFQLECDCRSSLNTLQLRMDGPRRRQLLQLVLDGSISGAELADLNADGWPELYLYLQSAGSGSYGTVLALLLDARQQLQQLPALPPLAADAAGQGYMGHDQFHIAGQLLLRRFPLYRPQDGNAAPTGGWRELRYRLAAAGDSWQLQLENSKP